MMNDTVSLFDSVKTESGVAILQYIISGVHFEEYTGATITTDGEKKGYSATVIIPSNFKSADKYVKPKQWSKLSFIDKQKAFTLKAGQFIVKTSEVIHVDSLDELVNNYDDVFRVIGVDTFSGVIPHFEVLCK